MADVNRHSSPMEPPPLGNAANTYKKQTDGVVSSLSDRESVLEVGLSAEEDRRLLRKIDLCLLPVLAISYMLQYLDKSAMGYTAIIGLRDDLNLVGQDYSWASSFFYFGYLAGSAPAAFLIVRFPVGRFMSSTIGVWAGILMLMAVCKNAAGLWAARFFLGFVESAIAPGMAVIISMWYKRSEQPLRQAAWFMGNVMGGLFGGLLSYGIGHINSIAPWKGLFLLFGGVTVSVRQPISISRAHLSL
ncbi:major facilitator superfamily domain-containing protein [Ilyonectria destructans]|nr:major facilitator superfamily domain-containing protein [Ilyonectria destructans]